jgi:hypothetical protein
MSNISDVVMLVLASIGALAFGILAAYSMLRLSFALMRPQPRPAAIKAQPASVV